MLVASGHLSNESSGEEARRKQRQGQGDGPIGGRCNLNRYDARGENRRRNPGPVRQAGAQPKLKPAASRTVAQEGDAP